MKNNYEIIGDYAVIYLDKELETVIDLCDLDNVINYPYKWFASYRKKIDGHYACATHYLGCVNGKSTSKTIYMHKYILGIDKSDGIEVDHHDNDTLNNRRNNRVRNGISC